MISRKLINIYFNENKNLFRKHVVIFIKVMFQNNMSSKIDIVKFKSAASLKFTFFSFLFIILFFK